MDLEFFSRNDDHYVYENKSGRLWKVEVNGAELKGTLITDATIRDQILDDDGPAYQFDP